jgi:hypothetical protein
LIAVADNVSVTPSWVDPATGRGGAQAGRDLIPGGDVPSVDGVRFPRGVDWAMLVR